MDSKTWFTHTDRWHSDLHKWPTFPGATSRGVGWMDSENIIAATTWFRNVRVPSVDGTENQFGFSAIRHRWVKDLTISNNNPHVAINEYADDDWVSYKQKIAKTKKKLKGIHEPWLLIRAKKWAKYTNKRIIRCQEDSMALTFHCFGKGKK